MILRLVDVSEFIYSGSKSAFIDMGLHTTRDGKYEECTLPCGGIGYLLNIFFDWNNEDTVIVFCIDSPPTYKRMLFENHFDGYYKGNRPPAPKEITVQKKIVVDVLEAINANYIIAEGYEADDIIASMVYYYHDDFDKIYIHAKDSDLFYLVDDIVEIMPLSNSVKNFGGKKFYSNGKHITLDNWNKEVKKGIICPRNILTLYKILDGEPGDNIPAVSYKMGKKIVDNLPKSDYPKCGDNKFLRDYILNVTNNDETVRAIVDLIQPVILPEQSVSLYNEDINKTELMNFATLFKSSHAPSWKATESQVYKDVISKYMNMYLDE